MAEVDTTPSKPLYPELPKATEATPSRLYPDIPSAQVTVATESVAETVLKATPIVSLQTTFKFNISQLTEALRGVANSVHSAAEFFLVLLGKLEAGFGPLTRAVSNGDLKKAEHLLKNGANSNPVVKQTNAHPLVAAVQNGSIEMVDLLIEHGSNPIIKVFSPAPSKSSDNYGYISDETTPLLIAIGEKRFEIAGALLDHIDFKELDSYQRKELASQIKHQKDNSQAFKSFVKAWNIKVKTPLMPNDGILHGVVFLSKVSFLNVIVSQISKIYTRLQLSKDELFLALGEGEIHIVKKFMDAGFDVAKYLEKKPHLVRNLITGNVDVHHGMLKFLLKENLITPLFMNPSMSYSAQDLNGKSLIQPVRDQYGRSLGHYSIETALCNLNFKVAKTLLENIPQEQWTMDIQERIEYWVNVKSELQKGQISKDFRDFMLAFKQKGQ